MSSFESPNCDPSFRIKIFTALDDTDRRNNNIVRSNSEDRKAVMLSNRMAKSWVATLALWTAVVAQPATLLSSYCFCPIFSGKGCACCTLRGSATGGKELSDDSSTCCAAEKPSCCIQNYRLEPDLGYFANSESPIELHSPILPARCCPPLCPCEVRSASRPVAVPPIGRGACDERSSASNFLAPVTLEFSNAPSVAAAGFCTNSSLFGPALLSFLCQWRK